MSSRTIIVLLFFYFIGNCDFWHDKEKHMFCKHMLDRNESGHNKKTIRDLEEIKTLFTEIIIKPIII